MDLNVDSLKKISVKMKALIVLVICLLLGYLYYMFLFQAILEKKMTLGTKLAEMQQQITEKEKVVAQLDRYIREVNTLKESFKTALLKLPNEREIAGLLSSVVLSGENAGVNFLLFEPQPQPKLPPKPAAGAAQKPVAAVKGLAQPAVPEKFYEDIPIKVQITGTFHQTVSFYAKIAKLPRIINVEDITMGEAKVVKDKGRIIRTACTIKTYMFVDKKT
jgi:type IV pilus assembly protein PilO